MHDLNLKWLAQAQTREWLEAAAAARERELTWEQGPGLSERLAAALGRGLNALGWLARPRVAPQHHEELPQGTTWERP